MTVVYKLDMTLLDATNYTGNPINYINHMYVNFVDFIRLCAANGLCTVVASNFGAGPSPEGDGENYPDIGAGAASAIIGENAWIYSEWDHGTHIMGVLIQFRQDDLFGNAPGNPGELAGSVSNAGVGWAMAVREDGASPWNGTGIDDGAASKGDPVWTAGASTHVFPMSNNPGHSNATSRENMARIFNTSSSGTRKNAHIAANENTILVVIHDVYLGGNHDEHTLGRYNVAAGMEGTITAPYFMLNDTENGGWFASGITNVYGDSAGTGTTQQGGVLADPAQGVLPCTLSYGPSSQYTLNYQPNFFDTKQRHDMGAMMLFSGLNNRPDQRGFCGWPDSEIITNVYRYPPGITNDVADRCAMGSYSRPAVQTAMPWDGGPPAGTLKDRAGRESVIIPE